MTGQNIIKIRADRDLSRAQLGAILGKSYRTILRWESAPAASIAAERPTIILLEMLEQGELPARYLGASA